MEPGLHEKNQKKLMRGFLRKSVRTDGRTDKRESIGLRDSSRPKIKPAKCWVSRLCLRDKRLHEILILNKRGKNMDGHGIKTNENTNKFLNDT